MEITCDLGVHATHTDSSSWSGQTMIDYSRNIIIRGFFEKAERSNFARVSVVTAWYMKKTAARFLKRGTFV